ncbi:hypothetical protein J5N97_001832 [Dioscorea zingiberensis]|uniref:NAA35-like TPR repeats domain-containing protein n=1 Tax=Dioscorea zingiberensis TaxID=325984 RepID=A0A9D5H1Y3_9LILI|nr:hypothetical protein J5N97_001832 [Dioscorea zingiberensis]
MVRTSSSQFDSTVDVRCLIDIIDHLVACEEEDLFTMAFGLPLKGEGDEKCLSILNSVEETISRQLRACKALSYKKKVLEEPTNPDVEPLQANADLEEGYCRALLCRLRFRKHFYHVLTCMRKSQGRGLELARKHIALCLSELSSIIKSQEFLRSNAIEYFEKLLHDLDVICCFSLESILENVLHFVVQFQDSQPDLVARAHMQLVVNLLKILCTNAAWQRRKLGKILQDWSLFSIQLELALKREFGDMLKPLVDENVCMKVSKHLLTWAEEQTYWIAARFLMLGFKLELYSPNEYCMVYWYMYIILMKLLEKIQLRLSSKGDYRRKGKKKRDVSKDLTRDVLVSSPSILLLQCYISLSEGLAMMLAALRNESKVFEMPNVFNSEQERFIQHFELLQKAHVPDHISYYLFKESTIHASIPIVVKHNYFREAQRISTSLRGSFSGDPGRMQELRRIDQVSEHNRIALNVINKVSTHDPSLSVTFEFTHHPFFAVAVVKRS